MRRQQNALRSLASTAISNGTLSDSVRAYGLADALTQWVAVDDTLMEGDQSVVYLDPDRDNELWFAMNTDSVGGWVATHPSARLPAAPR